MDTTAVYRDDSPTSGVREPVDRRDPAPARGRRFQVLELVATAVLLAWTAWALRRDGRFGGPAWSTLVLRASSSSGRATWRCVLPGSTCAS